MVRVPMPSLALGLCECKNGARGAAVPRTGRPRRRDEARPPRGPGLAAGGGGSDGADAVGLRALLALDDLEAHPLPLVEALVPVHLDGRVVDEDVLAAVDGDEAEALLGVEPLHGALCHVCSHVSCVRTSPSTSGRDRVTRSSARRTRTWNSNRARRYSTGCVDPVHPRTTRHRFR